MSALRKNELGQPIGDALPNWSGTRSPSVTRLIGEYCAVRPLNVEQDAARLFAAYGDEPTLWTYLPYGPFASVDEYANMLAGLSSASDPMPLVITDREGAQALGVACYMRIASAEGCLELGHICYSPALQRSTAATEAAFLMLRHVFDDLGYRRCEWKCDSLNAPSRRAAERLGFRLEGIFRQATVYKGRNRDTAWYSIIDVEWPALRQAFEAWLHPSNFDEHGQQRTPLSGKTAQDNNG